VSEAQTKSYQTLCPCQQSSNLTLLPFPSKLSLIDGSGELDFEEFVVVMSSDQRGDGFFGTLAEEQKGVENQAFYEFATIYRRDMLLEMVEDREGAGRMGEAEFEALSKAKLRLQAKTGFTDNQSRQFQHFKELFEIQLFSDKAAKGTAIEAKAIEKAVKKEERDCEVHRNNQSAKVLIRRRIKEREEAKVEGARLAAKVDAEVEEEAERNARSGISVGVISNFNIPIHQESSTPLSLRQKNSTFRAISPITSRIPTSPLVAGGKQMTRITSSPVRSRDGNPKQSTFITDQHLETSEKPVPAVKLPVAATVLKHRPSQVKLTQGQLTTLKLRAYEDARLAMTPRDDGDDETQQNNWSHLVRKPSKPGKMGDPLRNRRPVPRARKNVSRGRLIG
jgi:hypothetical protein